MCCPGCPHWHTILRCLRTIAVLLLLALPACPLFLAMVREDLEYQELAAAFSERGLMQSYNFYPGEIFSKVCIMNISTGIVSYLLF